MRARDGDGVAVAPAKHSNNSGSEDQAKYYPASHEGGGGGGGGAAAVSLWSPEVAAAMGYGKGCGTAAATSGFCCPSPTESLGLDLHSSSSNRTSGCPLLSKRLAPHLCSGRAGSSFQWWIPLLSAVLAIGSFIAWAVFVFRARDATEAALAAAQLQLSWWDAIRAILLATAVCFPVFTLLALGARWELGFRAGYRPNLLTL